VPGPLVLDVGAGTGAAALADAPGRLVVGLDRSGAALRRAAASAPGPGHPPPLVRADARALPVRAGALDGATAHSVLYLVPDPAGVLAELGRAVRPGGRVALLEPRRGAAPLAPAWRRGARFAASMVLWRAMSRLHRRFEAGELAALLEAAGFREVRVEPALDGFALVASATR
jgi:ubiquinone/menaquinone biosynthesis C-methylase UbiE